MNVCIRIAAVFAVEIGFGDEVVISFFEAVPFDGESRCAKGLVKGVLACAFQNIAFMLPTGLLYLLVKDLLAGSTSGRTAFYLLGCAACFALILLTTWFQYNGTYFTTYKETRL